MLIHGQCHCGNLEFDLSTEIPETEIEARVCGCSFCRIHCAKNWSDPNGKVTITVKEQSALQKYMFALKTAEFFVCRVCGGYLAAVLSDREGMWSTVNLRLTPLQDLPALPVDYATENAGGRISRRKRIWTPTELLRA